MNLPPKMKTCIHVSTGTCVLPLALCLVLVHQCVCVCAWGWDCDSVVVCDCMWGLLNSETQEFGCGRLSIIPSCLELILGAEYPPQDDSKPILFMDFYTWLWPSMVRNNNKNKFQKHKIWIPTYALRSSADAEKLSVPLDHQLCLNHDLLSVPCPSFCEGYLQKSKWCPKTKVSYANPPKPKWTHSVLNWTDKVKIWDLLKCSMSLLEAGQR
jgi:hypothetical protein